MKISRQDLIDAVESGIRAMPQLEPHEVALLRHVAKTEKVVARGSFVRAYRDSKCYCPLTAAGIDPDARNYNRFWVTFDKEMARATNYARILEVE